MTHILKRSCDLVCLTNVRFDQEATKASLGRETTLSLQEWAELVLLLRSLCAAPELLLLLPFPTEVNDTESPTTHDVGLHRCNFWVP